MHMKKRTGKAATGCFRDRRELVSHVWALRRQQIYPNVRSIAAACETSMDAVKAILETEEGLEDYLVQGCPMS